MPHIFARHLVKSYSCNSAVYFERCKRPVPLRRGREARSEGGTADVWRANGRTGRYTIANEFIRRREVGAGLARPRLLEICAARFQRSLCDALSFLTGGDSGRAYRFQNSGLLPTMSVILFRSWCWPPHAVCRGSCTPWWS